MKELMFYLATGIIIRVRRCTLYRYHEKSVRLIRSISIHFPVSRQLTYVGRAQNRIRIKKKMERVKYIPFISRTCVINIARSIYRPSVYTFYGPTMEIILYLHYRGRLSCIHFLMVM